MPAQREVVKEECHIFDQLYKWSAKAALFCSLFCSTLNHDTLSIKQKEPYTSKSGKPSAEITFKIANCGNLELFPEIKPIRREIICFHLRRHAIQFEVAHEHCTAFQFATDPAELNINKISSVGHLSIEIKQMYPAENQIRTKD